MPRLPAPTAIRAPGLTRARMSTRASSSRTACATSASGAVGTAWRMVARRGNDVTAPSYVLKWSDQERFGIWPAPNQEGLLLLFCRTISPIGYHTTVGQCILHFCHTFVERARHSQVIVGIACNYDRTCAAVLLPRLKGWFWKDTVPP